MVLIRGIASITWHPTDRAWRATKKGKTVRKGREYETHCEQGLQLCKQGENLEHDAEEQPREGLEQEECVSALEGLEHAVSINCNHGRPCRQACAAEACTWSARVRARMRLSAGFARTVCHAMDDVRIERGCLRTRRRVGSPSAFARAASAHPSHAHERHMTASARHATLTRKPALPRRIRSTGSCALRE